MIAWSVLTRYASGRTELDGCGLADTRDDANDDVVNAIRSALMDARTHTTPGDPGPTYTALIDADIALTVELTRDELRNFDLDAVLDKLEQFAARDANHSSPLREDPA